MGDPILQRALTYSLVVIGDTCKKIPDNFRQETTEFDWSKFAGLSDYLVHRYWEIDQDLFWEAVSVEVPINKEWIDVIIEQEASKL